MTVLDVCPVDEDSSGKTGGLKHIVCCVNKEISLCGSKLRPGAEALPTSMIPVDACWVCVDLWYESNECPELGQCKLNRMRNK